MGHFPKLRHDLKDQHPIVGRGYRLLSDQDELRATDETAYVSTLMSPKYREGWQPLHPDDLEDIVGKTVKFACEEMGDPDGPERVFRRRVHT